MIEVTLQPNYGIVILEPKGSLTVQDFQQVTEVIDPYILSSGGLKGLMILAESFPGWDSFSALSSHLSFIKNHHQFVLKVAIVTNAVIGHLAGMLAEHFVAAQVRTFSFEDIDSAKSWLLEH